MDGSHEVLFTRPAGVANNLIKASFDSIRGKYIELEIRSASEKQEVPRKENMMDNLTTSLGIMLATKELTRRCDFKRRKSIAPPEETSVGEIFPHYTGSRISRLDSLEQLTLTTTRPGLLRIQIRPGRRWKWWGPRGWLVVLHLLHEQDDTWKCSRFFTNFQEVCDQFGLDEDDSIWQCKV